MTAGEQVRHAISKNTGLNRGAVVRRMVRLGSPRLRELHASAGQPGFPGALLRPLLWWLDRGSMVVVGGLGSGLRVNLDSVPISHAHVGSIAFGNLEPAVQEAMSRHLGKGGVFFDVGANVGFFAMLGAHFAGFDEGHVYAFEAAPDNAEAIRANVRLNVIPNLTVIAKAVSDRAGTGQLQVVDDQSWSKLLEYGEHPLTDHVMNVELVAIDDLVEAGEVRPPTVVKIDVEGAEVDVLRGMRRTLAEHAPVVICELHDTHAEVLAFCREAGYRVTNLEGPEPLETAGPTAHALALPPGHFGD